MRIIVPNIGLVQHTMFSQTTRLTLCLLILMTFGFVEFYASASATDSSITSEQETLDVLGMEFRQLKKVRGHFQGGVWIDEVDQWKGAKHRVMIDLGTRLSGAGFTVSDVHRIMGKPDRVIYRDDVLFQQLSGNMQNPAVVELHSFHLYFWRGERDYLYFGCGKEVVFFSAWWYTGE